MYRSEYVGTLDILMKSRFVYLGVERPFFCLERQRFTTIRSSEETQGSLRGMISGRRSERGKADEKSGWYNH